MKPEQRLRKLVLAGDYGPGVPGKVLGFLDEIERIQTERDRYREALNQIHTRAVLKPDGDLLAQIAVIAQQALEGSDE